MTSKLDRIQENANRYKVLNCPAYNDMPNMYDEVYGYCDNKHDIDLNKCMCENITDCVIKQVIEKCKGEHEQGVDYMFWVDKFAQEILQLFDIEEINK